MRYMTLVSLGLVAAVLFGLLTATAQAAAQETTAVALTPGQYQQLNRLSNLLSAGENAAALELGTGLFEQDKGTPAQRAFIRSYVARSLVQVYQEREESHLALRQLQKVVEQDAAYLPADALQASRWLLVYLLTDAGKYKKALYQLEVWWQEAEDPSAEAKYLRAALLAQLERWAAAEPWILAAVQEQQTASWLNLGVAVLQRQEKWAAAAQLQHQRLLLTPEEQQQWVQLAQLQLLAKQESQALITLELAVSKGFLDAKQQEQLARHLMANQQPLRAAQLLEELLQEQPHNVELQRLAAQAWLLTNSAASTQKALQRLATTTQDAHDWQRLGDWNFSQGYWQAAVDSWQQALPLLQEESKQTRVELLAANAYIEMQDYVTAKQLLQDLLTTDQAASAKQWLDYLNAL